MPHGSLPIRTWILVVRAGTSIVYESIGREIAPVHAFERLDLDLIARWLDDARGDEQYQLLKLIAEPARARELMRRLPDATCARVVDVRTEDLSRPDDEGPDSLLCLRRALRVTIGLA